ncbi:MAG: hypothetical protein AAF717_02255 [Bacteroidota bacterium]
MRKYYTAMDRRVKAHILSVVLVIMAMLVTFYDSQNDSIHYLASSVILAAMLLLVLSILKQGLL